MSEELCVESSAVELADLDPIDILKTSKRFELVFRVKKLYHCLKIINWLKMDVDTIPATSAFKQTKQNFGKIKKKGSVRDAGKFSTLNNVFKEIDMDSHTQIAQVVTKSRKRNGKKPPKKENETIWKLKKKICSKEGNETQQEFREALLLMMSNVLKKVVLIDQRVQKICECQIRAPPQEVRSSKKLKKLSDSSSNESEPHGCI